MNCPTNDGNMDLLAIGCSAVFSALLFIVLEFTIILPLFRRIVTRAVDAMVQDSIIPKVQEFVHGEVTQLADTLTTAIVSRIGGFLGGTKKGVNAAMLRLAAGESLEDIEDDYKASTIEQILKIVDAVADRLPIHTEDAENGKSQKEGPVEGQDVLFPPRQEY